MHFKMVLFFFLALVTLSVVAGKRKKDYYDILSVRKSASPMAIRRAFRYKVVQFHPDKNKEPDAVEKFLEVVEAYKILSNPQLRTLYDDRGDEAPDHKVDAHAFHKRHGQKSGKYENPNLINRVLRKAARFGFGIFRQIRTGFLPIDWFLEEIADDLLDQVLDFADEFINFETFLNCIHDMWTAFTEWAADWFRWILGSVGLIDYRGQNQIA